jgi:hypothetical protein
MSTMTSCPPQLTAIKSCSQVFLAMRDFIHASRWLAKTTRIDTSRWHPGIVDKPFPEVVAIPAIAEYRSWRSNQVGRYCCLSHCWLPNSHSNGNSLKGNLGSCKNLYVQQAQKPQRSLFYFYHYVVYWISKTLIPTCTSNYYVSLYSHTRGSSSQIHSGGARFRSWAQFKKNSSVKVCSHTYRSPTPSPLYVWIIMSRHSFPKVFSMIHTPAT